MNWIDITSQLQSQGSIFWMAAFSMAAGATLLLVSGMILAKRQLFSRFAQGLQGRKARKKLQQNPARIELTDTGYKASHLPPQASPQELNRPSTEQMADLQKRLKKAANTLEDLHQSLKNQDQITGVSGLKTSSRDVEYVFKAQMS